MAFERGSEEFVMFTDFWNLCKKYWDVQDNDEWWDKAIADINKYCSNYKEDKFTRDLGMALLNRLERQVKENGKKTFNP